MKSYTLEQLSSLIDHTNLHPAATHKDMKQLCNQAIKHHFAMVAINQVQTRICSAFLKGADIHVGAAIGFPLGQTTIEAKVFETTNAIENGADEIDYVVNLTELKEKNTMYIQDEMEKIVTVCKKNDIISKVIFETAYLTNEEIVWLAEIAKEVKPDFIKTSTGHASSGATIEDVALMKSVVGNDVKVKAAGGIRDAETFLSMIQHGAERIGTSSGIQIIQELKEICKEKNDSVIRL